MSRKALGSDLPALQLASAGKGYCLADSSSRAKLAEDSGCIPSTRATGGHKLAVTRASRRPIAPRLPKHTASAGKTKFLSDTLAGY